jgi:hypothetical protein
MAYLRPRKFIGSVSSVATKVGKLLHDQRQLDMCASYVLNMFKAAQQGKPETKDVQGVEGASARAG